MNNCALSEDDIFTIYVYSKNEVIEMFGEDYLEEYGYNIPDELLKEYSEASKLFRSVQQKLRKIKNERDRC